MSTLYECLFIGFVKEVQHNKHSGIPVQFKASMCMCICTRTALSAVGRASARACVKFWICVWVPSRVVSSCLTVSESAFSCSSAESPSLSTMACSLQTSAQRSAYQCSVPSVSVLVLNVLLLCQCSVLGAQCLVLGARCNQEKYQIEMRSMGSTARIAENDSSGGRGQSVAQHHPTPERAVLPTPTRAVSTTRAAHQ